MYSSHVQFYGRGYKDERISMNGKQARLFVSHCKSVFPDRIGEDGVSWVNWIEEKSSISLE